MKTLLTFSFLFFAGFSFSQVQIGADLDGASVYSGFGRSVALSADGNRLAVGGPSYDGIAPFSGHVRIYDRVNDSWVQVGNDIHAEAPGDQFGWSSDFSSDGSRIAIGAINNNDGGAGAGHVRVFEFDGNDWTQVGNDMDGEAAGDDFGYSVSISSDGSRVAVGATNNDGTDVYAGHTRVFELINDAWIQLGSDIDGEAGANGSGQSVSLSANGNRVAIGAPLNGSFDFTFGHGHARVFDFDGSDWVQVGTDIDGLATGDLAGFSVSLSAHGDKIAVGEVQDDNSNPGRVRVFEFDGTGWVQLGSHINGENIGDYFGSSVALSALGNKLAVGARFNNAGGEHAGHVRVFEFENGDWVQSGMDIDGEAEGDWFGDAIALSDDGCTLAAGAHRNSELGLYTGHARAFDMCESTVSSYDIFNVVKVFPNPTFGLIELENSDLLGADVKIRTVSGSLITEFRLSDSIVDLSWLDVGIYFLSLVKDDKVQTARIIKF
ncbi:MAG: T9SS type A sorting domain-containing protein [Bacteroidota bacterium]